MKAARIVSPMKVELVEVEKPDIGEGEILIQSKTVSVCGSDMPFFLNGRPLQYPLAPGYPGHECIGVVSQSRCDQYKEGDEVLALPAGSRGFAEYFVSRAGNTVRLPAIQDNMVVAQPLGTVIHACRKLFQPIRYPSRDGTGQLDVNSWKLPDTKVAIVGQGSIGMLFTAMMRIMEAKTIIGVDLLDYRLDAAMQMGATDVVNASMSDPVAEIRRITNGAMADVVIEAVGKCSTINDCFALARRGATVIAFGVPESSSYQISFTELFRKELKLLGAVGPNVQVDFPPAVELVADGRIDVSQIVTHRLALEDIQEAFEMAAEKTDGAIKILLKVHH